MYHAPKDKLNEIYVKPILTFNLYAPIVNDGFIYQSTFLGIGFFGLDITIFFS